MGTHAVKAVPPLEQVYGPLVNPASPVQSPGHRNGGREEDMAADDDVTTPDEDPTDDALEEEPPLETRLELLMALDPPEPAWLVTLPDDDELDDPVPARHTSPSQMKPSPQSSLVLQDVRKHPLQPA